MSHNIKKFFQSLPDVQVPAGLNEKILHEIFRRQKRAGLIKAVIFSSLSVIFGLSLIMSIDYMLGMAVASGFVQFLSLLLTDATQLIGSSSYYYILAQTVPVFGVFLVMSFLIMFLQTARLGLNNFRRINFGQNN